MAAHPPEFDVDNTAGSEFDCVFRILGRPHRLVQADRSFDLFLQFCVIEHVRISQRLFDHHQIEFIEGLKERHIGERVS